MQVRQTGIFRSDQVKRRELFPGSIHIVSEMSVIGCKMGAVGKIDGILEAGKMGMIAMMQVN